MTYSFLGVSGDTGYSTGAHIHIELVEKKQYPNNAYYSQNIQNYFLNYIGAPSIENYTNNADVWNKNMNFYSNTYSQNYINTQNLWRLK